MQSRSLAKVLVYVPAEYGYYRDVLVGVARYVGRNWRLIVAGEFPQGDKFLKLNVVGVIGPLIKRVEEAVVASGIAAVNISSSRAVSRLPSVLPDNAAIGALAADHLLDRGYRLFASGSSSGVHFELERMRGFRERLASMNYGVEELPYQLSSAADYPEDAELLARLKSPMGIFTPQDRAAARMFAKVTDAGFSVPGEFAFVGVDNDATYCQSTLPQLSSVDPAADIIGFKAMQLLEELVRGGKAPEKPVLVPPRGVVARESTDLAKIEDAEIAAIVRFIREEACHGIGVKAIAEKFALSRRTMERRFIKVLNRSVLDEVRRVQLEHARELLTQTDLKVETVSERCGFSDFKNFGKQFAKHMGMPPGQYRRIRRMK